MTTAQKPTLPCPARKPPNTMMASLGTGMQALSRIIRMNTAHAPYEPTTSVAKFTRGAVISGMGQRPPGAAGARAGGGVI